MCLYDLNAGIKLAQTVTRFALGLLSRICDEIWRERSTVAIAPRFLSHSQLLEIPLRC